jgi:hypothetical protein
MSGPPSNLDAGPPGGNPPELADSRPIIGVSMGDPAGVGAEVIVKALADTDLRRRARFVIFGLNELMAYTADLAEIEPFWWRDQHDRFAVNGPAVPIPFRQQYPQDVVVLDYDEFSILGLEHRGATRAGHGTDLQGIVEAGRV